MKGKRKLLRTINEEYIIDVLKNHEFQLKKNQEEIKKILSGKDEAGLIRAASINHSESFNSRTNELHDLDDVYRKYKKLTHDWELSVKEKIRALLEEQETIWFHYKTNSGVFGEKPYLEWW